MPTNASTRVTFRSRRKSSIESNSLTDYAISPRRSSRLSEQSKKSLLISPPPSPLSSPVRGRSRSREKSIPKKRTSDVMEEDIGREGEKTKETKGTNEKKTKSKTKTKAKTDESRGRQPLQNMSPNTSMKTKSRSQSPARKRLTRERTAHISKVRSSRSPAHPRGSSRVVVLNYPPSSSSSSSPAEDNPSVSSNLGSEKMLSTMRQHPVWSKFAMGELQISGTGKKTEKEFQFQLLSLLGIGVSGAVFQGRCLVSPNAENVGNLFALKTHVLEKPKGKRTTPTTLLYGEFFGNGKYLNRNFDLLPRMIDYFVDRSVGRYGCEILVLEAFDISLADFFSTARQKNMVLTPDEYCVLAQRMIGTVSEFHEKMHEIHFDIKPANFLLRIPERSDSYFNDRRSVVLCDFGSATRIDHMEWKYVGTLQWMSRNTQNKITQTFLDDMEAVGYVLVAGMRDGFLPWRKETVGSSPAVQNIVRAKEEMISNLARGHWKDYIHVSNGCCIRGSESEMHKLAKCLCSYFDEIERLRENGDSRPDYETLESIWNLH